MHVKQQSSVSAFQTLTTPKGRSRNANGKIRQIRSDAKIKNVASFTKQPSLAKIFGPDATVGQVRQAFGGKSVSQIANLPKSQVAAFLAVELERQGVTNCAAQAVLQTAFASPGSKLEQKAFGGKSYYVTVDGQKLDRELLQAFIVSGVGQGDGKVSAKDAADYIVPELGDGGKITKTELDTYMFALRHFSVTNKAAREQIVPLLREMTSTPLDMTGKGEAGFSFEALSNHLQATGRFADLYTAKSDMSDQELFDLWDNGISLEDFNQHLQNGLEPSSVDALQDRFGKETVSEVRQWLVQTGQDSVVEDMDAGNISVGQFQNLEYGSWQMANTPYDADYAGQFEPVPLVATDAQLSAFAQDEMVLDDENVTKTGKAFQEQLGLTNAQLKDPQAIWAALGALRVEDENAFNQIHQEIQFNAELGVAMG